jgi:hypothetical protein
MVLVVAGAHVVGLVNLGDVDVDAVLNSGEQVLGPAVEGEKYLSHIILG